jgi:hypothetical protein
MSPADAVPIALLLLFGTALGIGGTVVWLAIRWHRRSASLPRLHRCRAAGGDGPESRRSRPFIKRPTNWLAIRSRDPAQVLEALSLSDPTPCSWSDGMVGENRLFIAPPVRGWVLVVGTAVPDPADDVDVCFRFLRELSRKLGHVQFFCADRVLHHHAWARVEAGRVTRAYAWAGTTLWNQGVKTSAESALDLKTFGYGEEVAPGRWGTGEFLAANVEKVPHLAARWSLDPAEIAERMPPHARGIAGRPSVRY